MLAVKLPVKHVGHCQYVQMFHTCPACMTVDSETLPWSTSIRCPSACHTLKHTPSTNTQYLTEWIVLTVNL